jgi:hypothetical protein
MLVRSNLHFKNITLEKWSKVVFRGVSQRIIRRTGMEMAELRYW